MIDLTDLMTHSYFIDLETLDDDTVLLTFIYEPGDYKGEFTLNKDQLARLKYNTLKLEKILHIK